MDAHANLAISTVATAPSPATSGTSLVVAAGEGALFPAAPFNITIWPTGAAPTHANAEIVRCTAVSTDTLTITRAQEGTSARTVVVGDQIANTPTVKVFTDIESAIPKIYLNKPAGNITRNGTTVAAFSTAWQITSVVVAAGQNVRLIVSPATSTGGSTNDYLLALFRGSTQLASKIYNSSAALSFIGTSFVWVDENPGAGTYTYEVRAAMFSSGTLTVYQSNITTDAAGGSSIFTAEVYTP